MIRIKTQKVLQNWRNIFQMATFFDSIAESRIQNPIKSLWWSFFAKIVNDFQLLTVFAKKSHQKYQNVDCKEKEIILFYILCLFCISSLDKVFSGSFRQPFFSFGTQKKWSLVMLDRGSSYTLMIAWEFAWADSALVVLDEWSSYKGGCLNRFDCNTLS